MCFSCEFCEISKKTFSTEHLRATASGCVSSWLHLFWTVFENTCPWFFFSWLYPKSDNDTKVCVWFVKKPNKHDKIDLRNKKNKTKTKQQNNASLIICVKDCLSYKKIFFRCKIKWMLDYFSLLRTTSPTSLYQQSDEIQCYEGIQLPYSKIPEQLFL